jgi:hypothetical protein
MLINNGVAAAEEHAAAVAAMAAGTGFQRVRHSSDRRQKSLKRQHR